MLVNLLVLGILCAAAYFVVKEEKASITEWLTKNRTPVKENLGKVIDFWKRFGMKPVRIVALVFVLILQKNVWGMLVTFVILAGISYYMAAKYDLLQKIDWEKPETQKIASLVAIAVAFCWLIDSVALLNVVYNIVVIGVLVIGCMSLLWLLFFSGKTKKDESKGEDKSEDHAEPLQLEEAAVEDEEGDGGNSEGEGGEA